MLLFVDPKQFKNEFLLCKDNSTVDRYNNVSLSFLTVIILNEIIHWICNAVTKDFPIITISIMNICMNAVCPAQWGVVYCAVADTGCIWRISL